MTDSAQTELDKMVAIFQDHAASNGYPMNDEHKRGAEIHKQAIINWHNKQIEALLDRLENQSRRADDCTDDTLVVKMIRVGDERDRLKESSNA